MRIRIRRITTLSMELGAASTWLGVGNSRGSFEGALLRQFDDLQYKYHTVYFAGLLKSCTTANHNSKASAKRSRLFTIHSSTNVEHC